MSRFLRTYSVEVVLVGALGLAVAFFGYLALGLLPRNAANEDFAGSRALEYAGRQMAFGARGAATQSNLEMGGWLVDNLTGLGWDVVIQEFTIGAGLRGRNFIAIRDPAGAEAEGAAAPPVGMVVTHYDTRLAADGDPIPENQVRPAPGANNGAAGTAVLLELARTLDVDAGGRTICLGFFDADANTGLPGWPQRLGSSHLARTLAQDVPRCANPQFVVALDLAGADGAQFRQDAAADPALQEMIWQQAADLGFGDTFLPDPAPDSAPATVNAQTPFAESGVRTALIVDLGYDAAATLGDTIDRLSESTLQRVGRTLEAWLE